MNGLHHYPRNSEIPFAKTLLKEDLIYKIGYYPINISYFEWDSIQEDKKADYLEELINLKINE